MGVKTSTPSRLGHLCLDLEAQDVTLFCVIFRGDIGEGGEGLSDILQVMQIDQFPLYASQVFGRGDGSSGGSGLGGGG